MPDLFAAGVIGISLERATDDAEIRIGRESCLLHAHAQVGTEDPAGLTTQRGRRVAANAERAEADGHVAEPHVAVHEDGVADVRAQQRAVVRAQAAVELFLLHEALEVFGKNGALRFVEAVLGHRRRPAEHVVSPGTYDQKHVARIGKLHDCIAYGPGILDLAHRPDEWVGIDDMLDSAKVMALALNDLLN